MKLSELPPNTPFVRLHSPLVFAATTEPGKVFCLSNGSTYSLPPSEEVRLATCIDLKNLADQVQLFELETGRSPYAIAQHE